MHLASVISANDTTESVFGHRKFSRRERGSNLGPLAPEASANFSAIGKARLNFTFIKYDVHCLNSLKQLKAVNHYQMIGL